MRYLTLLFAFSFFISCQTTKKEEVKSAIKKPTWLLGDWIRTNNKPNQITYEKWRNDFTGYGLTLEGKDTTFYEEIKLVERNNKLFLDVNTKNDTATTKFKVTNYTENSFLAENPQNEFPKKIKYWLEGKTLKAKVWNEGGYQVDFVFEKR